MTASLNDFAHWVPIKTKDMLKYIMHTSEDKNTFDDESL